MEVLAATVVQGLLIGAVYAAISLGFGVTYAVSGVVNFAHGDLLLLGLYAAASIQSSLGWGPYASAPVVVALLVLPGLVIWRYAIGPVAARHVIVVAQLTIGLAFVIQSLALLIWGPNEVSVRSFASNRIIQLWIFHVELTKVIAFLVAAILSVSFFLLLKYTDFGRSVRAIHSNSRAAQLMGVRVELVQTLTFAGGLGIVGLGAALLAPIVTFTPSSGFAYTLLVFIAVVIGGMDNFVGITLGALLIGVAESVGGVYVSGTYGRMLPYIALVVVLLLRPQGLTRQRQSA